MEVVKWGRQSQMLIDRNSKIIKMCDKSKIIKKFICLKSRAKQPFIK